MATLDFRATDMPRGLRAVLSLADGERYTIENLSNSVRVRIREAPTAPEATAGGHTLKPGGSGILQIRHGEDMWVWVPRIDGSAPCVLTEPA